ncbi:LOW QUALITY PROTEIN: AT-rich interactive domain-containing protein 3A-like [Thalassophryne amazonica]|uniref:LOW QUALITY PROTEIN: AT-rich interactive domain-containing protein 3A-like n=1 Tax=Thalassophryne amazonica TaxID=390379 RepID=UPI001470E577|nr:LOW QUALITY PROTEIN: AT-rich interactive domain-containing protein 3A-like [Thalassophryne amazonica]
MVDNTSSSKAQMPGVSQDPGVVFPHSSSAGGMKLEAVMEQLQRQQQARLEMERKERKLREAHIMYAQQVAAQQAILAAARASGAGFLSKGQTMGVPGGGLPLPRVSNQSALDSEREDEEDRGRDSGDEDDDNEMMEGDEGTDEEEGGTSGLEFLRKQTLALQQNTSRVPVRPFGSYAASAAQRAASPPVRVKQEPDEGLSPAGPHSATSPNGQADWSFEDHFRQNGSAAWAEEADSSRGRGEASRDFAKLYELDSDPKRKEFLDDLFTFMQKRELNGSICPCLTPTCEGAGWCGVEVLKKSTGRHTDWTVSNSMIKRDSDRFSHPEPINPEELHVRMQMPESRDPRSRPDSLRRVQARLSGKAPSQTLYAGYRPDSRNPSQSDPIMAKQVLDLYMLYKLVTDKGGLVEVINKKIWREITKGLNLPTSITSAAFTLRTQYMKYLYPYECERKGLSSPGELQAAIDSNRREGRRPSYSSSLFRFSPSPSTAPHILSPPKMHLSALGAGTSGTLNGLQASTGPSVKKDDLTPPMMQARPPMALALGQQQVAGLARAATLEQLREKLETSGGGGGEGPERKMARLAEEQQRLMQQAFQHNLLAMASQMPMNLRLPAVTTRDEKQQDMSLSISTNGNASITVSVEVNGTIYSGTLFAQKSGGASGSALSAAASAPPAGTSTSFGFSGPPVQTLSPTSSSSSKGQSYAEPAPKGSP